MREDTIAAIASPIAEGGIGIIRISGDDAYNVLSKIFCSVKKHISSCDENVSADCEGRAKELFLPQSISETAGLEIENRKLSYGFITDYKTGQKIDEVLAVYMKAPYTYTREDIVEIYCHGSVVALRKTLGLILQNGARLAEPGEFTKRAFLNGRLDLSQAEAVIDLIKAKTDTGFDAAMSQLEGELSREVNRIRSLLMDVLVQITVNIDYPDEDIEEITYQSLVESLSQISDEVGKLLLGADTGRIIKEGLKVAIIGKPNVGKSSLMNRLLKENRAIVTEVPGTTRDTIEESLSIKNILVSLTDTAGIRDTDDKVEQIGIERSKDAANHADLVILVVDGSDELTEEDKEIMTAVAGRKLIAVLNKRDKGDVVTADDIRAVIPGAQVIEASAEAGTGISEIEDAVEKLVYEGGVKPGESALVTNARHEDLMRRAKDFTDDAISAAEMSEPLDIIEIDVKEAYSCLGEIVGETVSDDIINEVFSRFCLGK